MNLFSCRARRTAVFAGIVVLSAGLAAIQLGAAFSICVLLVGTGLLGASQLSRRADREALLDRVIETAPVGFCLFDAGLRLIMSNEQFADMYGLPDASVKPGMTAWELLDRRADRFVCPPSTIECIDRDAGEVNANGAARSFHELLDGRIVSVSRHPMRGGGFVELHRDITAERAAEDHANEAVQALIERQYAIDQAVNVAITDLEGTITYANGNFSRTCGYSREELIGQNHRILNSGVHPKELFRDMYRDLANGQVWRGELCNRAKSGKLYWVDTVITPLLGPHGKPVSYMAIRIDITARKQAEALIAFAATHDSLTGLLNRSALLDQARLVLSQACEGSNRFSIHLIDLDGFKGVNDTLGHTAGDDLLRQVASRLRALAGEQDLVARLGGDEFAVVRRCDVGVEECSSRFSRLVVEAMAEPFQLSNNRVSISASVGIALCPAHGSDPEGLLKNADLALHAAKATGRNGFRLYQPAMLEAREGEKALGMDLREGLKRGEFELHYQPIIDVETRSIRAAEALIRWRHPRDGLIPPGRFIPAAEHTGLIMPLGDWIIEQACRHAASWPSSMRVAINVSALQFKWGNMFERFTEALLRSGLGPRQLEIEVTETALLEHQPEQLQAFRQLKNMGATLVLDDFGTGYSCASCLTNFPFDKIKIDRSFVQGLGHRRESEAVVASAVALAKGLGLTITAEGIETEEQFEAVRAMGIDFAQGYLFSRPVPHHTLNFAGAPRDRSPQLPARTERMRRIAT